MIGMSGSGFKMGLAIAAFERLAPATPLGGLVTTW
jgi:hypothetical protein